MGVVKTGYKMTEVGLIPSDWKTKELETIADVIDPHPSHRAPAEVKNGIPFLGIGDLDKNGNIINKSLRIVSWDVLAEHRKRYKFEEELLGLGRVASIGKVVRLRDDIGDYLISPTLGIIRCHAIPTNYAYFILQSEYIRNYFGKIMSGSTRSSVGMIVLRKIPIPHPPTLQEQKAIATALSDVDTLISQLDQLIEKKQAIKQGAMQELLTPPDQGGKRLEGFSGEWEKIQLSEVADFFKGKGLPKSELKEDGKYKCVHYGELFNQYDEIIIQVRKLTNLKNNVVLSSSNDYLMPTSDVTPNGLATGSAINEKDVILGGDILVIRCDYQRLDNGFLSYAVEANKNQVMTFVKGITVYHLYASDMKQFSFSIPAIEEQKAIAALLMEMSLEIQKLETKRDKYKQIKQGMMQELLTGKTRLV